MGALKDEEEKLRLFIKKIDSEITAFEALREKIEGKQNQVHEAVTSAGLQRIPVNIYPHSDDVFDLNQEINAHILNLNKLKNFINVQLEAVIKEEELFIELRKKFGKKVGIKKRGSGDFEIDFKDEETQKIFDQMQKSRREMDEIKKIVLSFEKRESKAEE